MPNYNKVPISRLPSPPHHARCSVRWRNRLIGLFSRTLRGSTTASSPKKGLRVLSLASATLWLPAGVAPATFASSCGRPFLSIIIAKFLFISRHFLFLKLIGDVPRATGIKRKVSYHFCLVVRPYEPVGQAMKALVTHGFARHLLTGILWGLQFDPPIFIFLWLPLA